MKKLLTLLFLLISLNAEAVILSNYNAGVQTDSCTSNLLFSWHMENVDVTLGGVAGLVNNGCSVGDTTATLQSSAVINSDLYQDGANSLDCPTASDDAVFDISSEDIFKHASGTIDAWVYIDTFLNNASILQARVNSSNQIRLAMITSGTNQFRLTHTAGGTSRIATSTISGGLSTGTWYHIITKWDETVHGTYYSQLCADTSAGTTNCGTNTGALGTWTGTLAVLNVGEIVGIASDFHMDNLKIYGTWQ